VANEILAYHEASKHHLERYARSPGYMDWANQPEPFRLYPGARVLALPLLDRDPEVGREGMYAGRRPPAGVEAGSVAGFLELSMGLSAWKAASGARWALRINPSSGNLHPTEAHLVLPPVPGLGGGGVFHYDPLHHALERRAALPEELWRPLPTHFGGEGFLVGLTSIFWREAWKYGERAFRYCNHDVGHALAALRFAAGLFGWRLTVLNALGDAEIDQVLGLKQAAFPPLEAEEAELLCWIGPPASGPVPTGLPAGFIDALSGLNWQGRPNRLSRDPVEWQAVYRAAAQSRKPPTPPAAAGAAPGAPPATRAAEAGSGPPAAALIRRRRSATAFDPGHVLPQDHFLAMLEKTLPEEARAPFDAGLGHPAAVDLLLFVHAVAGLDPGLYFLCRNAGHRPEWRALARPDFLWEPVAPPLPLYRLAPGGLRRTAARVSCHQEIAGDGAFSLGMLARFDERLDTQPCRYRRLFWESGMIGQVLYLEAEAHGVRGTGIGCFFDDAVHEILGLRTPRFQSIYHFTVGKPVDDPRIATHPPYAHLKDR
jgi:SagB-type dehydrogenase family enzyme